ncbi:DUF1145 domain-containing protein [Acinetobacter gyllenbergii]|nr:DUF1145 domain-containing protein [Acinetobacter gyllenbergii]
MFLIFGKASMLCMWGFFIGCRFSPVIA